MTFKIFMDHQENMDTSFLKIVHDEEEHYQYVYSINRGRLPSNFRSIFLTTGNLINGYKPLNSYNHISCDLLHCMKPKTKTQLIQKIVTVILLVTLVSFTLTMMMWKLYFPESKQAHDDKVLSTSVKPESQTEVKNKENYWKNVYIKNRHSNLNQIQNRTPCRTKCYQFSAFRFRSTCHDGLCECHGKGYQTDNCLPYTEGCAIQKRTKTAFTDVTFSGRKQLLYMCIPTLSKRTSIHVFSMFENSNSNETVVEIKGSNQASSKNIIIVLSSYRKTKWTVMADVDVTIKQIFLISTIQNKDVSVQRKGYNQDVTDSLVTRFRSQTGHGDDTCAGRHTVKLIQTITQEVGRIASFTGSKFSDHWSIDLDYF